MTVDWMIDDCRRIGRESAAVLGAPAVQELDGRRAVRFDGLGDGLILAANPLAGLTVYTVEVVFRPEADGAQEQRFFHAGTADGDRLLFETRPVGDDLWTLDLFVMSGAAGKALIDRRLGHPLGRWAAVAAAVDGRRVASYLDGRLLLEAALATTTAPGGSLSLGVRQDRRSWFRGAIARVRVTDRLLDAADMLRA